MSLSVSGRPPASLLTDAGTRSRLATLLPSLRQSLSSAGLSPPLPDEAGGELTETHLQQLLYSVQLFQHDLLGPDAKQRPLNPQAADERVRHPPRIPAFCFRTTTSPSSIEPAPAANSPVYDVLDAALAFLARRGDKAVEVAMEPRNTELIAAIRSRLREKAWIKPVTIAAQGDFTQAERDALAKMADSLECESSDDDCACIHCSIHSLHCSIHPPRLSIQPAHASHRPHMTFPALL